MKSLIYFMVLLCLSAMLSAQDSEKAKSQKEVMKPVLIVIDTQNEYMKYMDDKDKKIGLQMINWAMGIFRANGFPVVLVYHTDLQWGPSTDSEEFQFDSSLAIADTDPVVIKNYPNAFKKTELEKVIKDLGGNTLFLCGLSAVGCVIATYHGAIDNEFDVMLIEDALLSHDSGLTDDIENIFDSVNLNVLNMILKYTPEP